jgi:hypothetical protein
MKQAIKTAITVVRRSAAWYAMRSLEINLAGAVDTLQHVRCTETRLAKILAIRSMRNELSKARAHYNSFSKPGVVRVWDLA